MEEYPKYFTLDEARELLPEINKKLERAIRLNKSLKLLQSIRIAQDDDTNIGNLALLEHSMKQHRIAYLLFKELFEITKKGVVIKDIESGLIDFYSKYEGKDILLCWRAGENTINYWHEPETGFEGRKPVSLLDEEIEDTND
ncbi:DUF2203 domain-containing protein [Candidatus Woesearchaeota archaeon]|nr:MAG: hypothetical protein QT09_C0001G0062 [archaeon GW2011_AR18]MBS3161243.1 DUF2203 domain-containing protein [Candidatus Woesearchaeota archaeon]HIH25199.1 DUF2203 domain-containing protein [Nanoarchaeota archaeon]